MKILTLFLLLSISLRAEDWTTASGTTYHDVKVVKIGDDRVIISDSDGEAMIAIAKLPPDLQKRLNYDPVKSAAAAEVNRQLEVADAAQAEKDKAAAAAKQAAIDARRKEALHHPVTIRGAVVQVTPDGIIIRCPTEAEMMAAMNASAGSSRSMGGGGASIYDTPPDGGPSIAERMGLLPEKGTQFVFGVCFLKNYSDQSQLVDGARIRVVAYPDDSYSYQTTDGSTETIAAYTARAQ